MEEHTERDDEALAAELAARLDAGKLTPTEDDPPELKALLAAYDRLQEALPEPDPGLYQQIKESIHRKAGEPGGQKAPGTQRREAQPPIWSNKRWLAPAFYGLTILLVVAGFAALWWVDTLPQRVDEQQTILVGQTQFAPDSDASVRVVVQNFANGQPIEGALVRVSLQPSGARADLLFEGQTGETGSLPVQFHLPADAPAEAQLVVETESDAGHDRVEQAVTIQRDYRLLLSSDKPLYQPGQTIHMRALALSTLDLVPARGASLDFLVEDPKGNKVFRQSVTASAYGIAATDFRLADLVNQGNYKLSVSIGQGESATRSEKTVEVRAYVLPKFGVEVSTDRSYYLPGQRVEGVVQADYFYGKPVAEGQVQIVGSVWDVERTVVVDLRGQTDENGTYAFRFDLPEYFAGSGLESGQAQFALEVTVVDQADHAEQSSEVLPIAEQPLIVEAVAESGVLKPGVENVVYLLTSYPDGRPAPAALQVSVDGGDPMRLTSGGFGLAEFALAPQPGTLHALEIVVQDETGLTARRQIDLETEEGGDSVLLRADRATYAVGETMNLVALTPVESGSIYLDIVKAGQTLSTRSARVEDNRAEFAVDLSPDLYGTLELHAYKVLRDGTIVRDTRLVVVDEPNEIGIAVTPDKDTYLPGETATLGLWTRDARNPDAGVQSALGLAVVDESVFALQRQDPGFAKLYFLLEQELLEPFYQIKGFELPATIPADEEPLRQAQDQAVKATWAGAPALAVSNPVNSREPKMNEMRADQRVGFNRISQASAVGLILVPPLMFVVAAVAYWQARKRAFGQMMAAIVGALLVGGIVTSILAFVLMILDTFGAETIVLSWLAVLVGIVGLAFASYAWARRVPPARFLTVVPLAYAALLFLLVQAIDRGGQPSEALLISAGLAFLLIPTAYALLVLGRRAQARRRLEKLALAIVVALIPLVILCYLVIFLQPGVLFNQFAAPGYTQQRTSQNEADRAALGTAQRDDVGSKTTAAEPPRLRQYFPETLYWAPEILTDEEGFVSLQIPMADSITTWRLTALASSQDGRLGFATRGLRVFQDFFVDIDLPVALTQEDEISIPVGVFNYLPEAQEVRLVVEPEGWFELLGAGERTLTIASNDIEVVYFPIRVLDFGRQGFQVTAWGEKMSDAIRREVDVVPNGKEIRQTESDWLRESKDVTIEVPAAAVPDATSVEVKIYPGVMAQAVEGLEKILRLPHG